MKKRVAILISGRGSNMRALIEAAKAKDFPAGIVLVLSNVPDAGGLDFARQHGIETEVIEHKKFPSREIFDNAMDVALNRANAEIVCLAGFMRLLSPRFVEKWRGRMINIHPSLLPAYKGLHTHSRAIEAGEEFAGCTVHFVTPELDDGPTILQAKVPVLPGDTEETLAARVLEQEHKIYPQALRLVAEGKAKI
ncbi:MAG: phosphoribosylglycinamide formyltransferase [Xanthobacteraceae bacterium]|nr:phosphoribosylglycinamide formyltransferase [Xanthobacteraceae bacterium]MCW5678687.1 phosphoribosylglycinamide formyltransferase [Xanthobacteraceae bacterium]